MDGLAAPGWGAGICTLGLLLAASCGRFGQAAGRAGPAGRAAVDKRPTCPAASPAVQFVDWSSTVPARDPKFPPANKVEGDVSVDVSWAPAWHPAELGLVQPAALPLLPSKPFHVPLPPRLLPPSMALPPSPNTHLPSPPSPLLAPQDYTPERRAYENRRKVSFFQDDSCRRMYRDHVRAVRPQPHWLPACPRLSAPRGGKAGRQAGRTAGRQAGRQAGQQAGRPAGQQAAGSRQQAAGRQAGRQAAGVPLVLPPSTLPAHSCHSPCLRRRRP